MSDLHKIHGKRQEKSAHFLKRKYETKKTFQFIMQILSIEVFLSLTFHLLDSLCRYFKLLLLPSIACLQQLEGPPWSWSYSSSIFTVSSTISAYHHSYCEFKSRSGWAVKHYVIKFVSDLRQVGGFLWVLRFPPPIKLTATI